MKNYSKRVNGLSEVGAILFIALTVLCILSLLISFSLHSAYTQKILNHYQRKQLDLIQAEKPALLTAFNALKNHQACYLPNISDQMILDKSSNWWKSRCQKKNNNINVEYFYSVLQNTPCIYFRKKPVVFYALTVRLSFTNEFNRIIQSTVALPSKEMIECEGKKQLLQQTWQSVRVLRG
ncbi:MAG: hypothetical protein CMF39_03520 [Legionellaceae bacterium]|nr:hypothetical protein [Legionellaceae bacterium]